MLFAAITMDAEALSDRSPSFVDAENWLALSAGALLLPVGASRRAAVGDCRAVSSALLLYRGETDRWPDVLNGSAQPGSTKTAFGGDRGVHVRESIRLEVPVAEVDRFCRRLDNLPRFMTHLNRVTRERDHALRQIGIVLKGNVTPSERLRSHASRRSKAARRR